MMEADFELAQRLQTEEQGEITIEERSRLFVELINKRKKHFAMLRAEEKRRKPPTKAQKRNLMSTYLKNIGRYKHNQLKSKSYEEIHKLFDNKMRRVNTFIPIDYKVVKSKKETEESSKGTEDELEADKSKKAESSEEKAKGSRKKMLGKKRAGKEQQQESSKRQRIEDDKEEDEHEKVEVDDEAELKKHLVIVKDDEIAIDAIPLATKPYVIVEYKLLKEGIMVHYQLIRADGSSKRYSSMIRMLQDIDKEDLETLWKNRSRIGINKWYQSFALINFDLEVMDFESAQRNKEGQFRNQNNTRKQGNNEDTSSKAMLAIDGVGFDWSDMVEEQVQTNLALIAFSDSELNQIEFTIATYKRGLAIVEEQLITYRKNEVLFSEEVAVLKREVASNDYEINMLKSEFEKVKQEKEGIEFKIEKFDKASKDLDKLPKKLDLSYSGLDEFKEPEFKGYGSEDSKKESNVVSKDTSSFVESSLNVDKETIFPVDKKVESIKPKDHEKPVKKSVRYAEMYRSQTPRGIKGIGMGRINTARPQAVNTARPKIVKTARPNSVVVNDVRVNQENAIKTSTCWVLRPTKPDSASITWKKHNYIDARGKSNGCSRHMTGNIAYLSDFKEFDGESKTSRHVKRGRDTKIPQSRGPPVKVGDEAVHKELGDRMERVVTTASSLEVGRTVFWSIAKAKTVNGKRQIQFLIDKKKVIITESSIKSDLHLEDAEGTDCFPTATIFEELARMGYEKPSQKLTFYKAFFSPQWKFLIHTITQCLSAKSTAWNEFIFINQQLGDMSHHKKIFINPSHTKKIFANMKREGKDFSGRITPLFATMMVQPTQDEGVDSGIHTDSFQTPITTQPSSSRSQKKQSRRKHRKGTTVTQEETQQDDSVPTPSNDIPLSEKVKDAQAKEIADLKKRVQKLERKKKSRTTRLQRLRKVGESRRVESYKDKESLGDYEDASKQGRNIEDIDKDTDVSLVDDTQERSGDVEMFDTNDLHGDEVNVDMPVGEKQEQNAKEREVNTSVEDSVVPTTIEEITLAQTLIQIKAAKPKVVTTAATTTTTTRPKARGVVVQEPIKSKKETEESSKGTEDELEFNKSKKAKSSKEKAKGSRKKILEDDKETDEHEEVEVDDEAELKTHLVIVKDGDIEIDAIPLSTKPPVIVEYKLLKEGIMVHYQLIRANGSSKRYFLMIRMLQDIDREDLETLWKLVKTKHGDTRPEDEH
ncbi:hypothetical protein Tco_1152857 [Tanacetum coccineum]